ncbi:CDP-diacylglycerol-inositol 3-phosphatidyltransferase [Kluyveromyces marxianus]|nr:CDP-diacylglycerol-inositol 3-phosphatidyltransferase [Kluyveromyces marxianus]KAG0683236.1 CDP-diacylglycerol-inositol 3-phosphatidyltransferase [Kluyveromyces marxianus]
MSKSEAGSKEAKVNAKDVLWYIPNQIGYLRVVTMILSLFLMAKHPLWTMWVYGVSCLLDALDGTMARKYGQTSSFGAVLDMVTDRSTTTALICFLCVAYPAWSPIFQLLVALDISSHYIHMYATLSTGSQSHKAIEKEQWLLNLYYTKRKVLFSICALNVMFYMGLYIMAFPHFRSYAVPVLGQVHIGGVIALVCLPGYIFKQIANVVQLNRAALMLANKDAAEATERRLKQKHN